MSSSKTTLTNSCDWRPWLFIVKTMAVSGDVWKYINPDLNTPLPEPTRPSPPLPIAASSNTGHNTFTSLTADERDIYKLLYNEYKEDLSIAKQEIDILNTIRNHIVTTVNMEIIVYIESKETIHETLVALKKRLAPTDEARRLEVIDKYQRLRIFDRQTDVEL